MRNSCKTTTFSLIIIINEALDYSILVMRYVRHRTVLLYIPFCRVCTLIGDTPWFLSSSSLGGSSLAILTSTAGALCCTGATALLLEGQIPIHLIKLVERWRSVEVFRYLHT
jgi:hypothetical protein